MVSYGMCEEHLPEWPSADCHLGIDDFEGSSGWLTKWKGRYNIKKIRICGESGDVSGETVSSWNFKERLPELLQGYKAEDIYPVRMRKGVK